MMKKNFSLLLFGISVGLLAACTTHKNMTEKEMTIDYKIAHNYFFYNDTEIPASPIVTTLQQFGNLYGAAAVMGKKGQPTPIDFDRQFVIGIVLPLTNDHTEIIPNKLTSDGKKLTMHYKVKVSRRNMSWSMRPMTLIVVDKKYLTKTCTLLQE